MRGTTIANLVDELAARCSLDGLVGVIAVGGLYGALLGGERLVRTLISGWLATGSVPLLLAGTSLLSGLVAVFIVTMRHTDLASLAVGWPASLQVGVSLFGWLRHGWPLLIGGLTAVGGWPFGARPAVAATRKIAGVVSGVVESTL